MAAVVPGLPAPKPRSEVSVKILKGPVHLLESLRIHFPTSLAQALPTTRSTYHTIRRCNTRRGASAMQSRLKVMGIPTTVVTPNQGSYLPG